MAVDNAVHLSLAHLDDVVEDLKRNVTVLETRIEELEEELYQMTSRYEEARSEVVYWEEACLNAEEQLREIFEHGE